MTDSSRTHPDGNARTKSDPADGGSIHPAAEGVSWTDLTGFQRDLLKSIRLLDEEETVPTGIDVKSEIESMYGEDINHGRLYQNLNQLVEEDCIEKQVVDGRTYSYHLTDDAEQLLERTAQQFVETCDVPHPSEN